MIIVFFLAAIISIMPFPVLAIFYKTIPGQVPLFVDLAGNPTIMTTKSILSVFRLPVMGLMIQVICVAMYLTKLKGKNVIKRNKNLWGVISVLAALKMSLTSMELLFFENQHVLSTIRVIVLGGTVAAVIFLLLNLFYLLQKKQNKVIKEYYKSINKLQYITIAVALAIYILFVFLPMLI